ncbi:MAG: hypothetical protein WD847_04715 [Pirellulales bacterium]
MASEGGGRDREREDREKYLLESMHEQLPWSVARQTQVELIERIKQMRDLGSRPWREAGLLAWGRAYLPEHFTRPASAMHQWLERELEGLHLRRGNKLNAIGPRGGAKSTIGTLAYPLRAAVEAWEPYIWIVSDTKHQASSHLENIKAELVDNERLAEAYAAAYGRGPVWREHSIALANGVAIDAFGTGQRIRGRRRRANRPTLIICDDLQNDRHIESAAGRESSRRWFHGTLLKAGTKKTNVLNLATALHRDALAMELHRTPGWNSKVFRAIEHWPRNMPLWEEWEAVYTDRDNPDYQQAAQHFYLEHRSAMDEGAILLWPDEEDLYTLMRMRVESGRTAFEREKQGSPINPESCEWPDSYFDARIWFEEWPGRLRVKTMALDPSKGADARRGDFSAYVLLGVHEQGTLYMEADLARRATPQMVADGVELFRRFRPDAFGIEANQFQDLLSEQFAQEFVRQGLLGVRPWTLDNRVNKLVRIRRLGPYLSSRQLRFKSGSPSTQLLVNQLKDFPAGDHDDGPDAAEMAIRLALEMLSPPEPDDGLGGRLGIQ